ALKRAIRKQTIAAIPQGKDRREISAPYPRMI
ncbi:MAG: hypothetical protein ACI8RU_002578, partial [Zhongshania aliphaticivorans]